MSESSVRRGSLFWRRFRRNRLALVAVGVIAALVLAALVGPLVWTWPASAIDTQAFLVPPSWTHPFGTTRAGQDVLALTLNGLGKSLLIGLLAALVSTALAAVVGASAAYLGGWYERAMLWIVDLLLVIPAFFLIAIVVRSTEASWPVLAVLLAAFAWPVSARVVRTMSLSLRERQYVMAARFAGLSPARIIFAHLLPNVGSLLIVDLTLGIGYAILAEAGLSYFGFGVQTPDTSLGTLISEGSLMIDTFGWVFFAPASVLVVLVLCVNAVGDGLRDALDPTSTAGGRA